MFAGIYLVPAIGFLNSWAPVGPVLCAVSWFIACLLVRRMWPARLTVGGDGIAIREPVERDRFIPYRLITGIDLDEARKRLTLSLADGRSETIRAAHDEGLIGLAILSDLERDALATRVERVVVPDRLLPREGRSIAEWTRALGKLLRSRAYRDPTLAPAELVRLVEHPLADPELRVAATLALSSTDEPALLRRVRVVSSACADRDLERALLSALDGELDEAALEARSERRGRGLAPERRRLPGDRRERAL